MAIWSRGLIIDLTLRFFGTVTLEISVCKECNIMHSDYSGELTESLHFAFFCKTQTCIIISEGAVLLHLKAWYSAYTSKS